MTLERLFAMPFSRVYPCLVEKVERKGRTKAEVDFLITWLTGWEETAIDRAVEEQTPYGDFFRDAPAWNPLARNIRGSICGVRVEEIEEPTVWRIRCLDKLVDELAKGKTMDKILGKL